MTLDPAPPGLTDTLNELRRRIDSLERSQPQAATPVYPSGLTWSVPTDLPIRSPRDFRVESLWADTATVAAGDTTWELRRNGTAVGSVTVLSGGSHGHANLDPPVVADVFDVFTVVCTAGSGSATVRALGRSSSPDSPAVGGAACSPVPGGTLRHVGTVDDVDGDGGELVYTNASTYSESLLNYLSAGTGSRWVADVDCLLFVAYLVDVDATGASTYQASIAYGDPMAWSSAGPSQNTTGDTLNGQSVIALAAGDEVCITAGSNGTSPTYSTFEFTVLVVCSPAHSDLPPM